jgi:hypothetical protein
LQVGENYHSLPLAATLSSPFFLSRTALFSSVQRTHGCKQGAAAPMDGAQALLLPQASGALIPPCAAPLFLYLQQQEASAPLHFPPCLFPLFFLYVRRALPSWPPFPLLPWRPAGTPWPAPSSNAPLRAQLLPSATMAPSSLALAPCREQFPLADALLRDEARCPAMAPFFPAQRLGSPSPKLQRSWNSRSLAPLFSLRLPWPRVSPGRHLSSASPAGEQRFPSPCNLQG